MQSERDKVAIQEARRWELRRQAALEGTWQAAEALRAKLAAKLAFPISRTTTKDGKTIIEPVRWNFGTVVLMVKVIAELQAAVLHAVGQDVDTLTDAQARAVASVGLDDRADQLEVG